LNPRPDDYKSTALPTELLRLIIEIINLFNFNSVFKLIIHNSKLKNKV